MDTNPNKNDLVIGSEEDALRSYGIPWQRNATSMRLMFEPVVAFVRKRGTVRQHELLRVAAQCMKEHGYSADANGYPAWNPGAVQCGKLGIASPRQFTIRTVVDRCVGAMMRNGESIDMGAAYGPDPGQMVERLERVRNETIDLLSVTRARGDVGSLARNIIIMEDLIAKIEDYGPNGDHNALDAEVKVALNVAVDVIRSVKAATAMGAVH